MLKAKGLPLEIFFKVKLYLSGMYLQGIYDLCRGNSDAPGTLPFFDELVIYNVGDVLIGTLNKILQEQKPALQQVVDEYMTAGKESRSEILYRKLIDRLVTGALRFSGVERVDVEILPPDEKKDEAGQYPFAR